MTKKFSRRGFLYKSGGFAIGLSLFHYSSCSYHNVEPLIAGIELPFITEVKDFYHQNGGEADIDDWKEPSFGSKNPWKLTIDADTAKANLIKKPLVITLDDLEKQKNKEVSIIKTMRCVFDFNEIPGLISNGIWTGIPLKHFLEQVGIDTNKAKRLRIYGADGFRNNLKVSEVLRDFGPQEVEPLLVTHLNGEPLPNKYGAPVRLIVQDSYGYKNIKWIEKITVTEDDTAFGNYQDNGFVDDGVLRTLTKVSAPTNNIELKPGKVRVLGVSVSGYDGIEKVEVKVNQGSFQPARIRTLEEMQTGPHSELLNKTLQVKNNFPYPFPGVWAPWDLELELEPGEYTLHVRATDRKGNTQTSEDNKGDDGNTAIPVVKIKVAPSNGKATSSK